MLAWLHLFAFKNIQYASACCSSHESPGFSGTESLFFADRLVK